MVSFVLASVAIALGAGMRSLVALAALAVFALASTFRSGLDGALAPLTSSFTAVLARPLRKALLDMLGKGQVFLLKRWPL